MEQIIQSNLIAFKLYADVDTTFEVDLRQIKVDNLMRIIHNVINRGQDKQFNYILEVGDNVYTLSNDFKNRVISAVNRDVVGIGEKKDSDTKIIYDLIENQNSNPIIRITKKINLRNRSEGAFFNYYNKTHFDFSRYGVFRKDQITDETYNHNCLYEALKNGGLSDEKLETLKLYIKDRFVPTCDLNKICKELGIKISLIKKTETLDKNGKSLKQRTTIYGKDNQEVYCLGMVDKHYFINETTNNTSYSLKNYFEIKDVKDCNKIYKKKSDSYQKSNDRFINSFQLVNLLIQYKNDLLSDIDYEDYLKTQYLDNSIEFKTLNYDEKINTRLMVEEEGLHPQTPTEYEGKEVPSEGMSVGNEQEKEYIIFFDTETFVDKNTKILKPHTACFITEDDKEYGFVGEYCIIEMMNEIYKYCYEKEKDNIEKSFKVKLYAHNAKFDYSFLSKYIYRESICKKDGQFYFAEGVYYYKKSPYDREEYDKIMKVIVKDTYKIISMPISKFGKTFKLQQGKDVMPYRLYNEKSPLLENNIFRTIEDCVKYLKNDEDKEQFKKNVMENSHLYITRGSPPSNTQENEGKEVIMVNILLYSRFYCMIDCKVLKDGYMTMRKWILELCNIDINDINTIASLAHKYFKNKDIYQDVYEIAGRPRAFIQECVVGGRVMTANNQMIKKLNHIIADYDGCSLYPSSMERLSNELGGYLKGKPKVIKEENLNMDFLKTVDGYFVRINVKKVNKHYSIPLISRINKDGIREWNDDIQPNTTLYVDRITLEDLIKYHNIEFEIIDGYYYDEGRSNKIGNEIRYLYDERVIKKKEGNPIQEAYKLLMNSAYGKTILKPSNVVVEIVSKKDWDKYLSYNYNKIKSSQRIYDDYGSVIKYIVEKYTPINNHFNACHIGCEILSMSKRIMSEVIFTSLDNGLNIYYTDTDSIHMDYDDVSKLEKIFKDKYGRELTGSDMGQFHIDFDFKGSKKEDKIYADNSIFLGKKCYLDRLVCESPNGDKKYSYHIRLKGVPNQSILHYCENNDITPLQLYSKLYEGDKIIFDLTCGGEKARFDFEKNFIISDKSEFKREVCFK